MRRTQRTTIKDVGRRAGVSVGTVSKALNGTGPVSELTARKVIEAAHDLGYSPNKAAQGLVGGRSFQVGYGLPQLGAWGNPTLDAFLHAMVLAASGHGLEITLFAGNEADTSTYEELIRRGAVDGFVLSDTDYEDPRVDYLLEQSQPFVTFGRTARSERHFWVDVDGAAGTRDATNHVIARGHRRVAVIAWPEGSESGDLRVEGVESALAEHGLEPPLIVRTSSGIEPGRRAMAEILDGHPGHTAVITVQDDLAIGAVVEAKARRVDVGSEVVVVGFDDIPSASIVEPALTTVRQPFERIGTVMVGMLAEALTGAHEPRGELLAPELVVRTSTGGKG